VSAVRAISRMPARPRLPGLNGVIVVLSVGFMLLIAALVIAPGLFSS
jgi:hypothetical protein